MRKYFRLSAIALLSTALTVLPAHALSLNLGGGDSPLVDLGNDSNAGATVSVDTGNVLGTGDDVGAYADADAVIDLNLGSVGGGDNDGLLSGNGLIDLGADNDNDAVVDLDGDLIDLADLDVDNGPLLDLSADGFLDIDFGSTGGIGDTGDLLDLGTDNNLLDLGGGAARNGGSGATGSGGNSPRLASNSQDGNNTSGALVAACLTLDAPQLDELVGRHIYNRATFNSWASAQSLRIVEVDLCEVEMSEVAAVVGASANVAQLQAFLAAQAKVHAGLQSKGYAPGDVIAADHSGEVLTVYVI